MEIKTFRAKTMQEALDLVRQDMGPEAMVLHTRELNSGFVARWVRGRQYEIAASIDARVSVPAEPRITAEMALPHADYSESFDEDYAATYRNHFRQQQDHEFDELELLSEQMRQRSTEDREHRLPDALFEVYTDLIEADIDEQIAQEFVQYLQQQPGDREPAQLRTEVARLLANDLSVSGPIEASTGSGRVVALVGPTGVGKTTTIAKLAANFRLRENKRVGLITVDTYRIAAVEQLRTYADIIDLPMEVVSTPREMREAVARMRDFDVVLMDTAGRSPRDEVRIQELRSMLAEAEPDEVHLVLSATSGARSLTSTAERFATVGTTAVLVTKIDEATGLGNLLTLARSSHLPFSYLTDGQNVPDDIQIAESAMLTQMMLQ